MPLRLKGVPEETQRALIEPEVEGHMALRLKAVPRRRKAPRMSRRSKDIAVGSVEQESRDIS